MLVNRIPLLAIACSLALAACAQTPTPQAVRRPVATRVAPLATVMDTAFDTDGKVVTRFGTGTDVARAVVVQPADGKIVVAGEASHDTLGQLLSLARYNEDGSLDATFGLGGKVTTDAVRAPAMAVAVQALGDDAGKIIVTGSHVANDRSEIFVARFTTSGSLDPTFGGTGVVSTDLGWMDEAFDVAVQADDKILIAASSSGDPSEPFKLVRYTADGALDTMGFGTGGVVETPIGTTAQAKAVHVQSDRIYVGGTVDGQYGTVARYNLTDGSLDPLYGTSGVAKIDLGPGYVRVNSMAVYSDGRVVIVGSGRVGAHTVARLDATGRPDPLFGPNRDGVSGVSDAVLGGGGDDASSLVLRNGKIFLSGYADLNLLTPQRNEIVFAAAQFTDSGALDPTFDGDGLLTTGIGTVFDAGIAAVVDNAGRVIAVGGSNQGPCSGTTGNWWSDCQMDIDWAVVRYVQDGTTVDNPAPEQVIASEPTTLNANPVITTSFQRSATSGTLSVQSVAALSTRFSALSSRVGALSDPSEPVVGAEYWVEGGSWQPMMVDLLRSGTDPVTGITTIYVSAEIQGLTAAGVYDTCVRPVGASGTRGDVGCGSVVKYDDSQGGFITGGGWVNSPEGAYRLGAIPSPAGKATFGFVSKLKPGQNVPSGETEFQFRGANLNFKSTAYESLVSAGPRAILKGGGTLNGEGGYKFTLTAVDGSLEAPAGADRFRIKITRVSDGVLVYDNEVGTADMGGSTELGGGSIIIRRN